jgi:hypothetical protein
MRMSTVSEKSGDSVQLTCTYCPILVPKLRSLTLGNQTAHWTSDSAMQTTKGRKSGLEIYTHTATERGAGERGDTVIALKHPQQSWSPLQSYKHTVSTYVSCFASASRSASELDTRFSMAQLCCAVTFFSWRSFSASCAASSSNCCCIRAFSDCPDSCRTSHINRYLQQVCPLLTKHLHIVNLTSCSHARLMSQPPYRPQHPHEEHINMMNVENAAPQNPVGT